MTSQRLAGLRVLITQSNEFMGPTLCEVFAEHGAVVLADERPLMDPEAPARLVAEHGPIDVLVANLAVPAPSTLAHQVSEQEWRDTFAAAEMEIQRVHMP